MKPYIWRLEMTPQEVERYVDMCRAKGVLRLTVGSLDIVLGPEPKSGLEELAREPQPETDHRWDASGLRPAVDLRDRYKK